MLHSRIAASLAHRFVQEIVGGGRPELRDIAGTKPANGFGHELEFRYRHQIKAAQLIIADLRLRIESADRFQCIAKEIEAHRHIHARWIKIKNAAAYRVFARLAHGRSADKAIEFEHIENTLHADDLAGRDR